MRSRGKTFLAISAIFIVGICLITVLGHPGDDHDDPNLVTYMGNGGTFDGMSKVTSSNTVVSSCMFENGTKVFFGWNTKSDGTGAYYYEHNTVSKGTVLYAIWNEYNVSVTNISIIGDLKSVPAMINNTDIGSKYCSYNTVSDSNVVYLNIFDASYSHIKLISHELNDKGTVETISLTAIHLDHSVEYVIVFTHTGLQGSMFDRGNHVIGDYFSIKVTGNCNVDVNIKLTSKSVTTYNGNGGLYDGESEIFDSSPEVINCLFENGSKRFFGWNTESDGTGQFYYPGGSVPKGKILYAIWKDYAVNVISNETGENPAPNVPATIDGIPIGSEYCGFDAIDDSHPVYLVLFDISFLDKTLVSHTYAPDTDWEILVLTATYAGTPVTYTIKFTHAGLNGSIFDMENHSIDDNFSVRIIGNSALDVDIYTEAGTVI